MFANFGHQSVHKTRRGTLSSFIYVLSEAEKVAKFFNDEWKRLIVRGLTWDKIKHLYSKDFKKLQAGKGVTSYESMYAVQKYEDRTDIHDNK